MLYVHTQTKNSSNVPFDTDFIRFKITDKKVPKRTAIQETVLDAVRSYNAVSYTHLCGERNQGESHDRGLSGRNELLRYLRGRQFLFVQRQVRP